MASHLTMEERDRIAQLHSQQASQTELAQALGRSPATVRRELRRNRRGQQYYAAQAHRQPEKVTATKFRETTTNRWLSFDRVLWTSAWA